MFLFTFSFDRDTPADVNESQWIIALCSSMLPEYMHCFTCTLRFSIEIQNFRCHNFYSVKNGKIYENCAHANHVIGVSTYFQITWGISDDFHIRIRNRYINPQGFRGIRQIEWNSYSYYEKIFNKVYCTHIVYHADSIVNLFSQFNATTVFHFTFKIIRSLNWSNTTFDWSLNVALSQPQPGTY